MTPTAGMFQPPLNQRAFLSLIFLIATGLAGNYFRLSLFFGVDFLFGSIAVLIVVRLFGRDWGTLAAVISSSYTYVLWNHPYAALILIAEAFFLGSLLHRKNYNLALLDGIYWLLIGMPLVWLFYAGVAQVEGVQTGLVMLKQAVNGIFNALVASLIVTHSPLDRWVGRPQVENARSLYQILFNLFVAFVLIPSLLFTVLDGQRVFKNIQTTLQGELTAASSKVSTELGTAHQQQLDLLDHLGLLVTQTDEMLAANLQVNNEFLHQVAPDFHRVYITNPTGRIVAAYPFTEEVGKSIQTLGKQEKTIFAQSQRTLKPFSTNVHQLSQPQKSSLEPSLMQNRAEPTIGLGVPLIQQGQFQGIIYALLPLHKLTQAINIKQLSPGAQVTLVDQAGNIAFSTRSSYRPAQQFTQQRVGEVQQLGNGMAHWLPPKLHTPIIMRWKKSFYVQETVINDRLPWKLVVEIPAQPYITELQEIYIIDLALTLVMASSAFLLSIFLGKILTNPLRELAVMTTDLPDKLSEGTPIRWPYSTVTELNSLVLNFRAMAGMLTQKFREIQKVNITLENRVEDRTQELVTINSQLQSQIRERLQAEECLRLSEERFRQMAEKIHEVFWMIDVDRQEGLYVSPAYEKIWGRSCASWYEKYESFTNAVYPEDRNRVVQRIEQQSDQGFSHEYRIVKPDQSVRWIGEHVFPVLNPQGKVRYHVGVSKDITERKLVETQLLHDALHDGLTGLPNRALFMDRLRQSLAQMARAPEKVFALLFLDLDRFKVVNDSLGHTIGDQLLVAVAQRLESCLRPSDTVARLGGDEFTVLLDPIETVSDAIAVAERIYQALRIPFNINSHKLFATASIGVALGNPSYSQPEDLLRDADTAMYRAKEQGKNCYAVFDTPMYARAVYRLQLETDLRGAIERGELRVYYQPIVLLSSHKILGFEALVRWQHPEQGLISPVEFIPVAEETGLIIPLGEWVLRESCKQMHQWQQEFSETAGMTISVNLSSKQFTQPDLTEKIAQILEETGLSPHRLKLEITESAIMGKPETAARILQQLKASGIQLAVDDFGTGYSSLSYLHRFPIDTLKIDSSFVAQIDVDGEQIVIVRAIVNLAWSLGMSVTAEGVETAKQLAQLQRLKCEHGQGYFFSKPLTSEAVRCLWQQEIVNEAL